MNVVCMLSNHHAHLTQEVADKLFGENGLTMSRYLNGEGGPYVTEQVIDIEGPKGKLTGFRVLGPCRKHNQVELLVSDCYKLGVEPPVVPKVNPESAAVLKLIGSKGEAEIPCGIIAQRHVHMGRNVADDNGLVEGQTIQVRANGLRGLTFDNVLVSISPKENTLVMHIDTEEGNAANIKNGDILQILKA